MTQTIDGTAFAATVGGLIFLLWGLRNLARVARIRLSGGVSVGTVVDTRLDGEGEPHLTIEFLTDRRVPIAYEQEAPTSLGTMFFTIGRGAKFVGREFIVYYDITSPRRATISPRGDALFALFLATVGLLFIFGAAA